MYTDQSSLQYLLQQHIATPSQQKWGEKLLGYNFWIIYKPGNSNSAVDALSRKEEEYNLNAIRLSFWIDWNQKEAEIQADPQLQQMIQDFKENACAHPHYSWIQNKLFYKGMLVIPKNSVWIPQLLTEFHFPPSRGRSGVFRAYKRLASNLF